MKKKFLIVIVLTLGLVTMSLAGEGTWTQKTDMPTARRSCVASEVDGKIYVIGGWKAFQDTTPLATVEMYDPATDTWECKADMPTPRAGLATVVLDGKIYAIGGSRGTSPFPTVEVYDPVTDTWEQGVNMSTARWFHSAVVLEGSIYVIGGVHSSTMEEYNPDSGIWTSKASMPTDRWIAGTGVLNGRICVTGGYDGQDETASVLEYDPITDNWTQKADMPIPRAAHSVVVMHNRMYCVAGGVGTVGGPEDPGPPTMVWIYNPATDTWEAGSDILTQQRLDAGVAAANGKIYVFGGFSDTGICSTVEEYTPSPIVDFNGDGIVDCKDICIMVDYWGTDEPLYDIAPHPSGDGIVDVHDLVLLSDHLFEESYPFELLAYWKLDETEGTIAYDIAGDNDSLLIGDPVWHPEEGKRCGSLELDGIDDYIETDFILSPADGKFSVFAWIKGGVAEQVIISQADVSGSGETWLGTTASDGCLMTGLVPPPVGRFLPKPLESQAVVTDGQWHHVGFIWDGSYRCLYVDGIEVARDTQAIAAASLKHSNGGLYIGTSKTLKVGSFFSGLIDDVRIYNVALSDEKIAALTQ